MVKNTKNTNLSKIKTIEDIEKLNLSFEDAYKELENIVSLQEDEKTSLEENVNYYKLGKLFARYCQSILDRSALEIEDLD